MSYNKRNLKKNKKRFTQKNRMLNSQFNYNSTEWFNKTFDKIFDRKKNSKLIECLNENDSNLNSKLKLERFKKRNDLSNELIEDILKNKDIIKRLFMFLYQKQKELYFKIFQQYIYLPFNVVGNKHHKKFNEYYEFISQFNLGDLNSENDLNEEITLFRVMDENEYLKLINGNGIESPFYTKNPFYLQFMRGNNTFMNINTKSVFVLCKFKLSDSIIHFELSGESEVVMKKGSKPLLIQKYSEYGIEDVKNDLGEDVIDFLPLNQSELNNGFTYMDGFIEKGFNITKTHTPINNQWFRIKGNNESWVQKYLKEVSEVISDIDNNSNNLINDLRDSINQMKKLGSTVLNNPFN